VTAPPRPIRVPVFGYVSKRPLTQELVSARRYARIMCGRYATSASPQDLLEEFEVDDLFDGLSGPDYNVAPTVAVPAIFERRVKDTGEIRRRLAPLIWGLVPSWAKAASIGSRMINARLETVAEKPAFRRAFSARRCLLPADGFYEWYAAESPGSSTGRGAGKARKQPFFIHRADGGRLVMAGIYEIWRDPHKDATDDSAWLRTCSVITTQATDAAGHIHDRMPMVITREAIDAWLDPTITDPKRALELLAVTEAAALEAYAVSTEVNSVENNNPSLVEPLGAEPEPTPDQETLI
jgi:putative SOS response-associated peptidase YedK